MNYEAVHPSSHEPPVDDRFGFLTALLANSDDTLPYLVYADWLDERDDPRGDLMRLAAARLATSPDDPVRAELNERVARWASAHTALLGPLVTVLGLELALLDAAPAWLLFLHADLTGNASDPLPAGTQLRGTVQQNGQVFPTSVRVTARKGSWIEGEQGCDFGYDIGQWSFTGVVLAGRVVYVTDRLSGSVTYPGIYQGEVSDIQLAGRWRVPSYHQEGEFAFTRERSQ